MIAGDCRLAEVIDPLTAPGWDAAVANTEGALFQSQRWLSVLAQTYCFEFRASVERDGSGQIIAAIPYCRIDDIRGERVVVLPFSDFTVPLVSGKPQWSRLLEPLMEGGSPISMQTTPTPELIADKRFVTQGSAVRQYLALEGQLENLWEGFRPQARRHVRASQRAGIQFRLAQSREELRAFFELHLGVRKFRHGLLCQPFRLFEAIWEQFISEDAGSLVLGFYEDEVVGGCLVLEHQGTLYYKFAASHPLFRSSGVSHAAVLAAIDHGIQRGCKTLDLGRSDLDQPGLIDFKRRFGAQSTQLHRYVTASGDADEKNDVRKTLTDLTDLFVAADMPDALTERAGEILYPYFA